MLVVFGCQHALSAGFVVKVDFVLKVVLLTTYSHRLAAQPERRHQSFTLRHNTASLSDDKIHHKRLCKKTINRLASLTEGRERKNFSEN